MAKQYVEVYPDMQRIFDSVMIASSMDQALNVKIIAEDLQKKIYTLKKADALLKHETGVDVYVIVNQRIFEGLTPPQQQMQAEEALCAISWHHETGAVTITKGDVNTYAGILKKYGYDTYEVLQESIKSLYDKAKEEDTALNA